MTNNGSESLNNVFRIARQLSVCAIIENTWHKYVEWFYNRRDEMKYMVELAVTEIGNCWCQKPQLIGIPCDHLLVICSFRRLNYTQYVSSYYSIQYYINTWSGH
jgi:hypothetical protein